MSATFSIAEYKNRVVDYTHAAFYDGQNFYYLQMFSGVMPANPADAPGTPLTPVVNMTGKWGAAADGRCALLAPVSWSANDTGTIGYCRVYTSTGYPSADLSVGLDGSGASCILSSLDAVSGFPVTVEKLDVRMPLALGALSINTALANNYVEVLITGAGGYGLDLGTNASVLIYSGAPPASADAVATGDLLATIPTGAGDAWSNAASGVSYLNAALSANASATGAAGYARLTKGSYTIQGSVGTTGSGAVFILDSLSLTSGSPVSLTEANITVA